MVFKYNPQHHVVQKLKPGKQGMVGIVHDKSNKMSRVYKFSSLLNMNGTHEFNVIKSLLPLATVCPYFPTHCELVYHELNSEYEEHENPYELKTKHKLFADICISEYMTDSKKYTLFIEHEKEVNDSIIISLLKQTLIGILVAYKHNNFTHYDLHSENILVQKCPYNDVYVWYDTKMKIPYVVPSLGYIPRIIDYGFSYSDIVKGGSHTSPLDFMKEGYMSFRSDKFADFRILLTSMMEEMYHSRRYNDLYIIQKKIVKKLFKKTNIDWGSGWLKDVKACAVKYIFEMCLTCKFKDAIFESPTVDEHFYALLDLVQLLIPVPITEDPFPDKSMKQVFDEFLIGIREFVKHFYKLEGLFEFNTHREDEYEPNTTMGLYIIRASIDGVLETRSEYNGPGKSADAVRKFKNKLFDVIRRANTVYQVPKINYEKYMVSFYVMANALQSLLFREIYYREQYIQAQYHKMPVENSNEIFNILDYYMKVPYHYCKETRIILMDDVNMCAKIYTLNEDECFDLNSSDDVAAKLYSKLADKTAVVQTSPGSKMNVLAMINQECNIESPSNKVCMNDWSESESSSDSSDDEDFDVKYTWEHQNDDDDEVKSVYDIEHYGHDDDEK
jgi:hypothetical protein